MGVRPKSMLQHQVWIKVNTHVDQGVAEIVELLSTVPNLQTVDSCQGDPGEAYVYFRLEAWEALGKFLFEVIEPALRSEAECSASMESLNGTGPLGKPGLGAESSSDVFSALKEVLMVNVHTFACSGDSERKGLHS